MIGGAAETHALVEGFYEGLRNIFLPPCPVQYSSYCTIDKNESFVIVGTDVGECAWFDGGVMLAALLKVIIVSVIIIYVLRYRQKS